MFELVFLPDFCGLKFSGIFYFVGLCTGIRGVTVGQLARQQHRGWSSSTDPAIYEYCRYPRRPVTLAGKCAAVRGCMGCLIPFPCLLASISSPNSNMHTSSRSQLAILPQISGICCNVNLHALVLCDLQEDSFPEGYHS